MTAKLLPWGLCLYLTAPVGFALLYRILTCAGVQPTAQTGVRISLPIAQIMSSFIHKGDSEMCVLPACICIPCGLSAPVLQSE